MIVMVRDVVYVAGVFVGEVHRAYVDVDLFALVTIRTAT